MWNVAEELSGRSLDAAVSERVMELTACEKWRSVNFGRGGGAAMINEGCAHDGKCFPAETGPAHYSESAKAAFQVEDRIAELDLQTDYIAYLWIEVGATRNGSNFWTVDNFKAFWLCVHATAEQRCRAALATVSERK